MASIEHHGLIIPSSPEDRKRLKAGLEEMVDCLTKIAAIREHQKNIVTHLFEEFDIPKKLLTKVSRTMFEQDYQKVAAEAEDFDTLVDTLKLNTSFPMPPQPQMSEADGEYNND